MRAWGGMGCTTQVSGIQDSCHRLTSNAACSVQTLLQHRFAPLQESSISRDMPAAVARPPFLTG